METRLRGSLLLLALTSLCSIQLAGADSSFEGKKGIVDRSAYKLFGGSVEDLAIDSSGHAYVGLNSPNGIACTTDGAATWSSPADGTDLGNVHAVAVKPDGSAVFVVAGAGLFRSTDGCLNWTKISAADADYSFEVRYAHGTLLIPAKNGILDRSTDDGTTISHVTIAAGVTRIHEIAPSPTAGEFYALAENGSSAVLYRSADGGATWTSTSKSGTYQNVAVDPQNANHVFLGNGNGNVEESTDGAGVFNPLTVPPSGDSEFSFAGNRFFVGIVYTTDGGSTWHDINNEATTASELRTGLFFADPTNSSVLYAASDRGVARSADGGATWTDKVEGLYGVSIQDIAQTSDKNTVYLATTQGLAKTANFLDASPVWEFPVDLDGLPYSGGLGAVHLDEANPSIVYVGIASGAVYRSPDAGATWTEVSGAMQPMKTVDIAQTTDGTLYAAYTNTDPAPQGGVLKSANGTTWTNISTGSFNASVQTLTTIGNTLFAGLGNDHRQNAANQLGVWKYDGSAWTQISGDIASEAVWDLLAIGDTIIAATVPAVQAQGATGTILRSTDAGATWAEAATTGLKTDNAFYRSLAVDPSNLSTVYAAEGNPGGKETLYESGDQGATWNLIYTGLTDEVPAVMLVDGLLGGFNTGLFGFDRAAATLTLKYDAKKRQIKCTLKSENAALAGQYVNLLKKSKKKGSAFKQSGRKASSAKGVVTFPAKNIAKKTTVRCEWANVKSKTKKF